MDLASLPPGVRSRSIERINGLSMHLLEAGFECAGRPALLLLHGFPELAFSWREVMPALAGQGYHIIAPDRRGYGRTTGWDARYDTDLAPFGPLNQVQDLMALLSALQVAQVAAVIGHDFGSPLAGWCALTRPDVFRSVVFMSAPFTGAPAALDERAGQPTLEDALAALPRPRKHYLRYYATPGANANMQHAPQGLHDFLRAYFHVKSADWEGNRPRPLAARTAEELAQLPPYYVMDLDQGMAETVAAVMPCAAAIQAAKWLPEADLRVYTAEYARSGFQGGLNEYRCLYDPVQGAQLRALPTRTVAVPACFIGGERDWGVYQTPGALQTMQAVVCQDFRGIQLIAGAGHWVQQEQPRAVSAALQGFLATPRRG